MANRNLLLWDAVALPDTFEKVVSMTDNYSIFCQAFWTGLTGTATFTVEASNDQTNWTSWSFIDSLGNRVNSITITGTADNFGIVFDEFMPNYIKFKVTDVDASAGAFSLSMVTKAK